MDDPEKSSEQNNEVTLVLQGDRITARKDKLIRNSLYFAALFSENFRDHQQKEFEINFDISLKALQNFVSWADDEGENTVAVPAYHFDIEVSLEKFLTKYNLELLELLRLSVIFAADKLIATITEMVVHMRLRPRIWVALWVLTEDLSISEVLRDIAFATCLDRFETISMASLLALSEKHFYKLFFNANIKCSMNHKLKVIKAWRKNIAAAQDDSNGLKSEIQLPDCSPSTQKETKNNSMNNPADPIEIIADSYYLERIHELTCPQLMSCIVGRGFDDNLFVWAWNGEKHEMEEITKMTNAQMYTTLVDNGKEIVGRQIIGRNFSIYLIGGELGMGTGRFNTTLWRYCLFAKKWYIETTMPRPRRHMIVAFWKNKLYLIGGVGRHRLKLYTVDVYDIHTGLWSQAANIPESFTEVPASCVVDGLILYKKSFIYFYNTLYDHWGRFDFNRAIDNVNIESMFGYENHIENTYTLFYTVTMPTESSRKLALEKAAAFLLPMKLKFTERVHEWYLDNDSHRIYQQVWNDPFIVSFGCDDDGPYVEINEYFDHGAEMRNLGSYSVDDDFLNVPADCFKYRLGSFNIIDPRTLHKSIIPNIFELYNSHENTRKKDNPALEANSENSHNNKPQ